MKIAGIIPAMMIVMLGAAACQQSGQNTDKKGRDKQEKSKYSKSRAGKSQAKPGRR